VLLTFLTLFLSFNAYAGAGTSKDLNKLVRNAQSLYFKGKAREANDALEKAEKMAAEIMAGTDEVEKNKIKGLEGKINRLRKDIDKKLGKSMSEAKSSNLDSTSSADKSIISENDGGSLPSHVTSDLKVVERYIGSAQKSLDSGDTRNARRSISNAQNKLQQTAERKKRYFSPEHPEFVALQKRIDKLEGAVSEKEKGAAEKNAAAAQAAANYKAESDKWVAVLKPYVTGPGKPGYDPERYFVASFTEEKSEMAKRSTIFGMLSADMEAYRESGIGENATDELKLIVRDNDYALKTFQESTSLMAEFKIKEAERQIDYITKWLNNEAKKTGSNDLPNTMNKMTFKSARRDLDGAARLLDENNERVRLLETKYQEALALDAKLAKIRVEQTRMIPDKFGGSELNVLKKKSEEVLRKAKAAAKVLRTTVVSPDWQEENVIEWTDTSRSALRHRVTRSVSTQVAGKLDGETTLYTIHIAKDRRTDGSWGQLHGHIMFEDPILEKNVQK
jgi:hypothetical protein